MILVITGIYLGLIYTPSDVDIDVAGQRLPQAYASVLLIESIPVANLFRTVHHWAAHVMIAAVILRAVRVFPTGAYRKPREVNWVVGVVLLGLTLVAGFVGYALPHDAFAVTATGIGYALARSIPVVGGVAADIFFGGPFPTLGSLPRLYTIHVVIVRALITVLLTAHLVIVLEQKHTQPGLRAAIRRTGWSPGRSILAVPGVAGGPAPAGVARRIVPAVRVCAGASTPGVYGPPGPQTPDTKPGWYLLSIYGVLKLVPNGVAFSVGSLSVGPEFVGGVLFPAVIFGLVTPTPWLDRSNRGPSVPWYEYLEAVRQAPLRFAFGLGLLAYLGMLYVAAYYDTLGLNLWQAWVVTLSMPVLGGASAYRWARGTASRTPRFDPTGTRRELRTGH